MVFFILGVINWSFQQKVLELQSNEGVVVVCSETARKAFSEIQTNLFKECGVTNIVAANIQLIEKIGGGSVRCMIAEMF